MKKVLQVICCAAGSGMIGFFANQLNTVWSKDAADEGFHFVEAYVNKDFVETDHDFKGPLAMYLKCGFDIYAERESKVTVRKALN